MTDVGMILDRIGRTLVARVVPELGTSFAAGQAGMVAVLAVTAGEAFDGAADRVHREIEGLRALLAAGGVTDETRPASLRLSDMALVRDRLAARLIAMQTALEVRDDGAARSLNGRIWAFLLEGASERMPSPPQFPDAADGLDPAA